MSSVRHKKLCQWVIIKKNFADSILYMSLLFMNILATCKNAMYHCNMTGLDFHKSFKEIENCEVF